MLQKFENYPSSSDIIWALHLQTAEYQELRKWKWRERED